MRYWVVVVTLAGCGRVAFDSQADAGRDSPRDVALDAQAPSMIRFAMDNDPSAGMIVADPPSYSVACAKCPVASVTHVVGTGAYLFDGSIRNPIGTLLPADRVYTITLWVNADPANGFGSAISKQLDTTTVLDEVSLPITNTSTSFEGAQGGQPWPVVWNGDLRGAYHHIAMTADGSGRRELYIDAALAASDAGPFEMADFPMMLGADTDMDAIAVPYIGLIDDLRIYPRILTQSDLAAVFAER